MGAKQPYKRYRPVRATDSAGGYTTTLVTSDYVWGRVEVHENEVVMRDVDSGEDVKVGDVFEVDDNRC